MSLRVLLIEENPILQEFIESLLKTEGFTPLCFTDNHVKCDVILVDPTEAVTVKHLRSLFPTAPMIVTSIFANRELSYLRDGAEVFLLKPFDPDILICQLKQLGRYGRLLSSVPRQQQYLRKPGEIQLSDLTPRERDLVSLLVQGLKNEAIAEELNLSSRTVESHINNVFGKTGLHSRVQVAVWALCDPLQSLLLQSPK